MRAAAFAVATVLGATPVLAAAPFDHSAWESVLHRFVDDDGRVAYKDLAAEGRGALDGYLRALANAQPDGWPSTEQIAFWVNAYNAMIVKAVLEGHTAESVVGRYQLFSRFSLPIAGRACTPDYVEKTVLHALGESRVHFALVWASTSSPKLRRHAWVRETLDHDLEEEATRFVRDPRRNEILPGSSDVRVSMIFRWYADDFGANEDAVRRYVARYAAERERRFLEDDKPYLDYLHYDWTLNAQDGQRPK